MIPGEELDTNNSNVVYPRRLLKSDETKGHLSTKGKVSMKFSTIYRNAFQISFGQS